MNACDARDASCKPDREAVGFRVNPQVLRSAQLREHRCTSDTPTFLSQLLFIPRGGLAWLIGTSVGVPLHGDARSLAAPQFLGNIASHCTPSGGRELREQCAGPCFDSL